MTDTTGSRVAEYLAALRAEILPLGDDAADDIVTDIASMLHEAALEGPESTERMLDELGPPDQLAARVLAERGLGPEGGMAPAEWWRLGAAAVTDAVVGLAVPVAAFVPLYLASQGTNGVSSALVWGLWALFAGSLLWPWYAWRPWRVGGSRTSAGMALAGISVVRLAGVRRVVRTAELERLGLAGARRGALSGLLSLALALGLVLLTAQLTMAVSSTSPDPSAVAAFAGDRAEQERGARRAIEQLHAALARGDDAAVSSLVDKSAVAGLDAFICTTLEGTPTRCVIGDARSPAPGVWVFPVALGATDTADPYEDTYILTVSERVLMRADGADVDWVVTRIAGPEVGTP